MSGLPVRPMAEGDTLEREDGEGPGDSQHPPVNDADATTVGTGSAIGLGCLALVAVLVLAALVYRWLGGTW